MVGTALCFPSRYYVMSFLTSATLVLLNDDKVIIGKIG